MAFEATSRPALSSQSTGMAEGGTPVEDPEVFDRINALAHEEHAIWQKESRGEASDADRARLRQLEVTLDRLWDLLHQRRARRDAGLDPKDAKMRNARTVEGYIE
jgi:hypothetical protein